MNIEFVHDLLAVLLNGFDADAEFRADFLVGKTIGNELEDLAFPGGEGAGIPRTAAGLDPLRKPIVQTPGDGRAEKSRAVALGIHNLGCFIGKAPTRGWP